MEKMFYFMNVDISWIKQRPHYLAEELLNRYELEVYYPYFYSRKVLTNDGIIGNCKTHQIFRVPNRIKIGFLHKVVDYVNSRIIRSSINIHKPKILFITNPSQTGFIPKNYNGIVIYDCMDDLVALATDDFNRNKVILNETKLVKISSSILVSSLELKNVLMSRYGNELAEKITLCRNAYNGDLVEIKSYKRNELFTLLYFGTISSWFDMKLIISSLTVFDNIKYVFAGPVIDGVVIPEHDRIEYVGIVDHEKLENLAQKADCFIMPFVLNEVTKAVDPVKFYEYINYYRNIISINYQEIQRYSKFVCFYDDENSYFKAIEYVMNNSVKYSINDRVEFLLQNKWSNRVETINQVIEELERRPV